MRLKSAEVGAKRKDEEDRKERDEKIFKAIDVLAVEFNDRMDKIERDLSDLAKRKPEQTPAIDFVIMNVKRDAHRLIQTLEAHAVRKRAN